MKVSVIITSYNQGKYLPDAIESALKQTSPPYEIIICDDFSTKDNTREIIKEYSNRYPDLIKPILQERNLGIAANRNTGFKAASGEYITWLDGDDRFLPKKIERELEVLKKNTWADIAYSNIYYTDEKLNRIKTRYKAGEELNGNLFGEIATRKLPPPLMMMVHRKCFDEIGYMDESLKIYEDWEWKIRLAGRFSFVYCPEPLYEYRHHHGGVHNLTIAEHFEIMLKITQGAINLCDTRMIPRKEETKKNINIFMVMLQVKKILLADEITDLTFLIQSLLNISERKALLLAKTFRLINKLRIKINKLKHTRLS